MDLKAVISELERNGAAIEAAYEGISSDGVRWKPSEKKWSLLEVLCHLADEEKRDFRTRVRVTLESTDEKWPPIDPEGWVTEFRYNEQDLDAVMTRFREERAESLRWLRSLKKPDWEIAYEHPALGPLRAGDLLASWAAHDLLHLKQIAHTKAMLLAHESKPFSVRYADPSLGD